MAEAEVAKDADKGKEVRFVAEPRLWRYLGWLSRNTLLGETEGEVAHHLLRQKLTEMRREDYKDPERT